MTSELTDLLLLCGFGLLTITLVDVLGSITSRKLTYKYVYLTPVSLIIYGLIGYVGYQIGSLMWTLLIAGIIGIYDGTIGWRLSIVLKANFGDKGEQAGNLTLSSRITGMAIVSCVFGLLGFVIAGLFV